MRPTRRSRKHDLQHSQAGDGVYDEINIRLRIDDTVTPGGIYYSEGTEIYGNTIYGDGAIRRPLWNPRELTNSDR